MLKRLFSGFFKDKNEAEPAAMHQQAATVSPVEINQAALDKLAQTLQRIQDATSAAATEYENQFSATQTNGPAESILQCHSSSFFSLVSHGPSGVARAIALKVQVSDAPDADTALGHIRTFIEGRDGNWHLQDDTCDISSFKPILMTKLTEKMKGLCSSQGDKSPVISKENALEYIRLIQMVIDSQNNAVKRSSPQA